MKNKVGSVKLALTIAGSDSGGGAGIQADLKTFFAHGLYGMSVITSVTAQNTRGVFGVYDLPPDFVELQLRAIFDDLRPDVVKIGMLSNSSIIKVVAAFLRAERFEKVVLDPVMVAKGGSPLLKREAISALIDELIPLALVITPNIPEAEALTNRRIRSVSDMKDSAKIIVEEFGAKACVLKGGHLDGDPVDVLYYEGEFFEIPGERVVTKSTHGTGCTFASAISSNIALGFDVVTSVYRAKRYVTLAIKNSYPIGSGFGPVNHLWNVKINLDY